jgi:hypothetical protein
LLVGRPAGCLGGLQLASRSRLSASSESCGRPVALLLRMRSSRPMTPTTRPSTSTVSRRGHASSNVSPLTPVRRSIRTGGTPIWKTVSASTPASRSLVYGGRASTHRGSYSSCVVAHHHQRHRHATQRHARRVRAVHHPRRPSSASGGDRDALDTGQRLVALASTASGRVDASMRISMIRACARL